MNRSQIKNILADGELPGSGTHGKWLETHISWVLLSGPYAFKIKKPVTFSFLDFSTLEARKHFLEEELRLNRRLAPEVYLDILPVVKLEGGRLAIGHQPDTHRPVQDYCLRMKRLDSKRQLDYLLQKGEVEIDRLERLALILARFHQNTDAVRHDNPAERETERYRDLEVIFPLIDSHFSEAEMKDLRASLPFVEGFLFHRADRLAQRQEQGWVIDGHGDLHSGNIFLLEEPIVFDCIEFDPDLRQLDILNELGFFLMDLDFHEREDLGSVFLKAYLRTHPIIENDTDRELLLYFKMYRANVRLKVTALGMNAEQPEPKTLEKIKRFARLLLTYFRQLKALEA
jgi:hypothetical protein